MKYKRVLIIFAAVTILFTTIPGCIYHLFIKSPKVDWNKSPEALIITEERPFAELDYNYIPDFQIWGDGYIVWVDQTNNEKRMVFEGYLTEGQMTELIEQFIQAGFFKFYSRLFEKDYAFPHIRIALLNESYSKLIDNEDIRIYELVEFVKNGAGASGREYLPTKGKLIAISIDKTSWPSDTKSKFIWPDDEFGYDLGMLVESKEVSGAELAFAWNVVNQIPIVESKGIKYWIAVVVPKIMP